MKAILRNAVQNYKKLIVLLAFILVLYFLFAGIRFIIAVAILIAIGTASMFHQYFFKSPINFELVKLVTVVSAVTFGPVPALMIGIISSFLGKILTGRLEADFIASIVALTIISFLASAFQGINIVVLGIAMVVVYHIIIFPIVLMMGGNIGYGIIYTGSNIVFNVIVFSLLATPFLWVLHTLVAV